jgi:hypothetical protein
MTSNCHHAKHANNRAPSGRKVYHLSPKRKERSDDDESLLYSRNYVSLPSSNLYLEKEHYIGNGACYTRRQ